jgi:hypothetical protein
MQSVAPNTISKSISIRTRAALVLVIGLIGALAFITLSIAGDWLVQILGMNAWQHASGEDYVGRVQNLTILYVEGFIALFLISLWVGMWLAPKPGLENRLLSQTLLTYFVYLALIASLALTRAIPRLSTPFSADSTVYSALVGTLVIVGFPLSSLAILIVALIGGLVPYRVRKMGFWEKSERLWLIGLLVVFALALCVVYFVCFAPHSRR